MIVQDFASFGGVASSAGSVSNGIVECSFSLDSTVVALVLSLTTLNTSAAVRNSDARVIAYRGVGANKPRGVGNTVDTFSGIVDVRLPLGANPVRLDIQPTRFRRGESLAIEFAYVTGTDGATLGDSLLFGYLIGAADNDAILLNVTLR